MYDLGNYILDVAMVIATLWIVGRFWGSFFRKKKKMVLSVSMWILFCIFQLFSLGRNGDMNIGMMLMNALLIMAIVICGYECSGKAKYFLLVVFCVVWVLVEMFTFFLLSGVQKQKDSLDVAGMVISKLLMIIFVYIVSVIWNKKKSEMIPNNLYLYLLFIPMGSVYIAVNQFYFKEDRISSMITISILLLFNVVIFEIYIKMNEMFQHEKEKAVYARQLEIISENTIEQKKIMEEFHEEKHNLINELIVLKGGIENDDKKNVIRNLNKIINNCHSVETVSNSGNSTVDTIINFKYAVAKEYGIDFRLKIFIPEELPIEQCDIGAVLGNAIDNAMEAVEGCKKEEKVIEISMGVKKEAWIMVIKNPYEHEIRKDRNGKILTTKREEHGHGYGLRTIMRIADEYQGEVITDIKDGIFSLTVLLNFKIF